MRRRSRRPSARFAKKVVRMKKSPRDKIVAFAVYSLVAAGLLVIIFYSGLIF